MNNITLEIILTYLIQWLETEFLGYLDEWDSSVKGRTGFSAAEMKKMRLSDETLEGLRVTGMDCIYIILYNYVNNYSFSY